MLKIAKTHTYQTSDGRRWEVWREAQDHEKALFLHARLAQLFPQATQLGLDLDKLTRDLLATEGLLILPVKPALPAARPAQRSLPL